jgi:hypothetical protein
MFRKLPPELRAAIWKECLFPQVVAIKNTSYEIRGERYMASQTYFQTMVKAEAKGTVPAILHVNQEARAVGLKAWNLEFESQLGRPVYFNCMRDALFMENFDDLVAFYGGPWEKYLAFPIDMSNVEKNLRHLVIGEPIPHGFVPKKIISRLYNLEDLTLPRPSGRGFAADKVKKRFTEQIHYWMGEKQEMYSVQEGIYKDWMLPVVEFMSAKQLSAFKEEVRHSVS